MQDTSEDDFYDWPINSKSDFISIIDKYNAVLREISLQIHGYRELGFHEYQSAKLLCDFLEKEGFTVERGIAGDETAFVATFGQGKNGPRVSFNAEYDALPEIGHACGHNLIAICSLGAALATKAWLEEDSTRIGVVKLFGTPGEETTGGKIDLINAGFYKDVDISLMSHPSIYDGCYLPTIAVHAFDVEFWGKSSHAAMAPWKGLNALDALIQAFNNINALRQSILPTMRIHGIIVEGGKAENIIPDYTKGSFAVRARTAQQLLKLKADVLKCFEGAALSTRCKFTVTEKVTYKDLQPNDSLARRYESYASKLGVRYPSRREQEEIDAAASTDQGNVSYELPTIQAVYKIAVPHGEENHTAGFALAAKTMEAHEKTILSSKALASVAVDFLSDFRFRKEVDNDFELQYDSDFQAPSSTMWKETQWDVSH